MIILYSFFLMITPHHAIFLVLTTIYSRKMVPHLASYLLSFFCVFCLFLFVFDSSPAFFFFFASFLLVPQKRIVSGIYSASILLMTQTVFSFMDGEFRSWGGSLYLHQFSSFYTLASTSPVI